MNFTTIPPTLTALPHWVCWKLETRDGRPTKIPYNARTGGGAMSNNPSTWSDFPTARAAYERGGYAGIGFMLDPKTRIIGVDLDHCLDPHTREPSPQASEAIALLDTYAEITPSGEGLRLFCLGQLPPRGRKRGPVEMYDSLRFLTVTGNHLKGTPLTVENRAEQILKFHAQIFSENRPVSAQADSRAQPLQPAISMAGNILEMMFRARNGTKSEALYNGQFASYCSSHSEADAALCCQLAFWTGRDGAAVDRLFRSSGLMRPKWDERRSSDGRTYGQLTVAHALKMTSEIYNQPELLRGNFARAYIVGKPSEGEADEPFDPALDDDERALNNGLYAILNGRTVLAVSKTKSKEGGEEATSARHFVCDFAAHIAGEVYDESGLTTYLIEGRTITGHRFSLDIAAGEMTDPKRVASRLSNVTRSGITIYAGMEKHLGPAIQSFTNRSGVKRIRSFSRTGWTKEGEFLIHGMEPPDVRLHLPKELSFRADYDENFDPAPSLDTLLRAHNSELSTIAVAHALLAPLAGKCDWDDEKYALFMVGRSGTFKTSFAQMVMSLFGDFGKDDRLLRFGNGGTVNALMHYPAGAADMPLMIDNFKPGTGNGQRDAQTLIHGLLEGTEKKRLTRDGQLRDTREFRCWLMLTGEETVNDAASVARMLILNATYESNENEKLTWCQSHVHLLPKVGGAWLHWLQSDGAKTAIESQKPLFGQRRAAWTKYLRRSNAEMINALRVATSLAICESAWHIGCEHPTIGPTLIRWKPAFEYALKTCAANMADTSATSHEGVRFIEALRAMVEAGRGYFAMRHTDADPEKRAAFLGWKDEEFVYLHPQNAMNAVLEYLRNQNGLNGIGLATIMRQLNQLGYLAATESRHLSVKKRVGNGERPRVLVIACHKFFDSSDDAKSPA